MWMGSIIYKFLTKPMNTGDWTAKRVLCHRTAQMWMLMASGLQNIDLDRNK